MVTCDRCGCQTGHYVELRNPTFSNGVVSKMESSMVVCIDCHAEMKEASEWEL